LSYGEQFFQRPRREKAADPVKEVLDLELEI
jgi:hypothetical protein